MSRENANASASNSTHVASRCKESTFRCDKYRYVNRRARPTRFHTNANTSIAIASQITAIIGRDFAKVHALTASHR